MKSYHSQGNVHVSECNIPVWNSSFWAAHHCNIRTYWRLCRINFSESVLAWSAKSLRPSFCAHRLFWCSWSRYILRFSCKQCSLNSAQNSCSINHWWSVRVFNIQKCTWARLSNNRLGRHLCLYSLRKLENRYYIVVSLCVWFVSSANSWHWLILESLAK